MPRMLLWKGIFYSLLISSSSQESLFFGEALLTNTYWLFGINIKQKHGDDNMKKALFLTIFMFAIAIFIRNIDDTRSSMTFTGENNEHVNATLDDLACEMFSKRSMP